MWPAQHWKISVIVDRAEEESSDENFQLSGIGAGGGRVPLDRPETIPIPIRYDRISQEARNLGYPGNVTEDLELMPRATWWSAENSNIYPHRYPIHDRCWTLIHRYVDVNAEKQLEQLIITLRRRWHSGGYGFEELLPMEPLYEPWIPAAVISTIGACNHFWVFQADPVKIPAVKRLVQQSIRPTLHKDCYRNQEKQPVHYLHMKGVTLPPEIRYMILDLLGYQNVETCLKTLGWSVSDIYWRQRIAMSGLLWEHEDVPVASIDWKFLCLEVERHIATATTLAMDNRKRIRKIFSDAKVIYRELDLSIRLQDFVNETYEPFTGLVEFDMDKCMKRFKQIVGTVPIWDNIWF